MADLTQDDMRMELARLCAVSTQTAVGERLGFSAQFINDVLAERRGVTDALANAMGYRRVVRFKRKEGVPRG